MNNYVISLPNAIDRRKHIENEFKSHNLNFEFFDAVQPSTELNNLIEKYIPNLKNSSLTDGEKGCLISHLSIWKKCIENNYDYVNIFEDDIRLSSDSEKFIKNSDWLTKNFDTNKAMIIKYETYKMPVKLNEHNSLRVDGRKIAKLESSHWGTAGYLITQKMAKQLLNFFYNLDENSIMPIDKFIFESLLKENEIYQLSPAICIQDDRHNKNNILLPSGIGNRTQNTKINKKSIIYKLNRELFRTYRKIYQKWYNFKEIPFL